MTVLDVNDLACGYGNVKVLEKVFFRSGRGECIGIIGPNGSGKSTLLKALSKIIRPTAGSVVLGGRDLRSLKAGELAKDMAVVPQETAVDFHFTALEIVLMGRNPHLGRFAVEGKKDFEIARVAMELTDTWRLMDRAINELSGGERQRVIVARALAQEPSILLLDEPVSHLDINHQIEIMELIDRLKRERGLLIILVLHDLNLAARYCDRLILLNESTIQVAGTPEEVLTREHVLRAFRADVLVRRHPLTGSIYITLMNPVAAAPAGSGRTVHVIAGAGTGTPLMYALAARGYRLTAGVLNVLDTDYDTAAQLNVRTIDEAPFSPVTPEASAQNLEAMKAADLIVISDVPFGWGNLKNLEAALAVAGTKPVVLIEGREQRDFTGGKASGMLAELKQRGAIVAQSVSDAVEKLGSLG